jgi:ferric-dicitrate binding protein FerR (iron transport regulator)
MNRNHNETESGDDDIGALLRQTGARIDPPADAAEEIRRAVHAEWQAVTEARMSRRRTITFGIAASVAAAMVALALTLRAIAPAPAVPVALLQRMEGALAIEPARNEGKPVRVGRAIMTGETVITSATSRTALQVGDHISVRLDSNTTLAVLAQDRLELRTGAVYVDAAPVEGGYVPLEIVTAAGSVRHLGTQYQVRSRSGNVTISVREGRIQLAHDDGHATARAGEQLIASAQGGLARTTLSPSDPSWGWATQIAPAFEIEDRPLATFLDWVARETGRRLVYASPSVAEGARELRLRGSIANLTPDAALAAVLATTRFEQTASEQDFIRISERD